MTTTKVRPSTADTVLPVLPPETAPQSRRVLSTRRRSDVLALLGAGMAAVALAAVLFRHLAPLTGALGFLVVTYAAFLALYVLLVWLDDDGPNVRDRLMAVVMHTAGFVLLATLGFVVVFTLWRGRHALVHLNFYTDSMSQAGPREPLNVGGILHALIGTLEQAGIALAVTVPLGIVCAVFLAELPGPFSRLVRTVVEAMTALPSIVAGLFIYATLILALGVGRSGFCAAMAISVMMLPIIIRAADVVLRLVPGTLREASFALGASQWRTVWHVVLPTARSGLMTAIILGTARGIGETSPVLLTAGFTAEFRHAFSGAQVSLPLETFILVNQPQDTMKARAFGAAAVLLTVVLVLFIVARIIGGRGAGQATAGQLRRRARASARDERRLVAARPEMRHAVQHGTRPDESRPG